jgi:ABC-type uncharacterized transport system YnjBCD substrate-binding protein
MKRKLFLLSISIILLNFTFKAEAQQRKITKTDQIAAPEQVAPIPSAKLNNYPRKTTFEWKHVEGASKYGIEVEYNDGKWHLLKNATTNVTSYTMDFIGKQTGRWRVRSISKATGQPGPFSGWWEFTYTK